MLLCFLQTDLEDQAGELRNAEESAKKAMSDAARLAEEVRQEQEHASHIDKMRRTLEAQVKELQLRLDEAESNALKGGKRMIQKLEQRVRELEVELDNEQRRHAGERTRECARQDRQRLKELGMQADEDRKELGRSECRTWLTSCSRRSRRTSRQVESAVSAQSQLNQTSAISVRFCVYI